MDDSLAAALPSEGLDTKAGDGAASNAGISGALSFLTAEWVNSRLMNVANLANDILSRIIDRGLLADGFAPFESPITDDMLVRMTPQQFAALYETVPSEDERAALLARMKSLKLPLPLMLPRREATQGPTRAPRLSFGPGDEVNFGSSE